MVLQGPSVITRRKFLQAGSLAAAGIITGCATNPVTGENQLMLISERDEVNIDKKNSPHQFSSDYGPSQDAQLNAYINSVGMNLAAKSHRPGMPYNFRAVNATYVNAYAFPGGSVAATRGILVSLDNEAELAALMGHEIGHVNARHTASRMTTGMLAQIAVVGLTAYVGSRDDRWAPLAAGLGGIGAGLLLVSYSRADERQADELGMEYMTRAGHNPKGMVGLMEVLRDQHKNKPNALEIMFSTHPMSDERYATAASRAEGAYPAESAKYPSNRERYMDNTAGLRAMKGAIEKMQNGEKAMVKKKFPEAEGQFSEALSEAPEDYAGLLMMAKCQIAMEKYDRARAYATKAKQVYPNEAQAKHVAGLAGLLKKDYDAALADFDGYERVLPGNPNTIFFKGLCHEKMGHRREAANEYYRYLQQDRSSKQARYSYDRLVQWGYIREEKKQ